MCNFNFKQQKKWRSAFLALGILTALASCSKKADELRSDTSTLPPFWGTAIFLKVDGYEPSASFCISANLLSPSDARETTRGEHGFNFIDGIRVRRSSDTWVCSPIICWPNYNDTLSFYAYAPASPLYLNGFSSLMSDEGLDRVEVDYTVPARTQQPEAFLVAACQQFMSRGQAVKLHFYNALSRLNFDARNLAEGQDFHIDEIRLLHLYNRGKLNLFQNFQQGNVYWEPLDSMVDYVIDGTGEMFVLPQGFNTGRIEKIFALKADEAEPSEPGILLSYTASDSTGMRSRRVYYPFPKLYAEGHYTGDFTFSGDASFNAFCFQLNKAYKFTFIFDGKDIPKLMFSSGARPI